MRKRFSRLFKHFPAVSGEASLWWLHNGLLRLARFAAFSLQDQAAGRQAYPSLADFLRKLHGMVA